MKLRLKLILFLLLVASSVKVRAQVPTVQDCLGALTVCEPTFTTRNSYLGSGNYLNEFSPGTCLEPGDYNSTWMTLTVTKSGNLNFVITPAQPGDYDFAVYNLTNATCADIMKDSSLEVSCNSAYTPLGPTGCVDTGLYNYQGPVVGTPFNKPIPVLAGETYTINIENWNGFPGGFTIDFGSSTAGVFDTTPPKLTSAYVTGCDSNIINFSFSEYIACSTIQDSDFTLTGPGGPYTLSGVYGFACSQGGTKEKDFSIQVTPAIKSGNYQFNLVGADGFVSDLCGNIASATTIPISYHVPTPVIISSSPPSCGMANGTITVGATGGIPPYMYSLNGGAAQLADSFTHLGAGIYTLSVLDSSGCHGITIKDTLKVKSGVVNASITNMVPVTCGGLCNGTAVVTASGGGGGYTYSWSSGASTATASGLCAGNYIVTVSDAAGCFDTSSATIGGPVPITAIQTQKNVSCNSGNDGSATVNASGGTGSLSYGWSPSGGSSATAANLSTGNYTVVVTDQNNCTADFQFTITQPLPLVISPSEPDSVCKGQTFALNAGASGGTPPYSFVWDNGAFTGGSYSVSPATSSTYTCVATDANNCSSLAEDFSVTVMLPPAVNLGNDTILCTGKSLTLNAYFPNSNFKWNDGTTMAKYTVENEGLYFVKVTNNCGSDIDSINILYHDCNTCLHFPNAFSPNANGRNDYFRGLSDCTFTSFDLRVYNRWGQLMYESNDPTSKGWDGTYKGTQCEIGSYVYIAIYTGLQNSKQISETIKGNVELIR